MGLRAQMPRDGATEWYYSGAPAIRLGWKATFVLMVNLPEYIPPDVLHDVIINAGRLIGVGDSRPTYGRFQVSHFELTGL